MKQLFKIALICLGLAATALAAGCNEKTEQPDEPSEVLPAEKYTVSVSDSPDGSAIATIDGEEVSDGVEAGTVVTLVATPDADRRFVRWSVESKSVALPARGTAEFVMPAGDVSIKPEFAEITYYSIGLRSNFPKSFITARVLVNGVEAARAGAGDEITLQATALSGYGFSFWMLENAASRASADDIVDDIYSPTTKFLMPEYPISVNCKVQKNAYWVRVGNDGNGYATVGLLSDANAFYWGSNVEVVPIPNPGYKFKEWTEIVGIEIIDTRANPLRIVTPQNEVTMKATFETE